MVLQLKNNTRRRKCVDELKFAATDRIPLSWQAQELRSSTSSKDNEGSTWK